MVELFDCDIKDADPYAKVNAEWNVFPETEDGDVKFTIYNWKDGYIPTEEYEWHIGGYGFDAVDTAYEIINVEIEVH